MAKHVTLQMAKHVTTDGQACNSTDGQACNSTDGQACKVETMLYMFWITQVHTNKVLSAPLYFLWRHDFQFFLRNELDF